MEIKVDAKLNFGFSITLYLNYHGYIKGFYFKMKVSILSLSFAGFECVGCYRSDTDKLSWFDIDSRGIDQLNFPSL